MALGSDPIDGTSNFVHGLPLCSVSLALLHRGHAVVAVTHAPLLGRTYHAIKDNGAFLNGQPITASGTAASTRRWSPSVITLSALSPRSKISNASRSPPNSYLSLNASA